MGDRIIFKAEINQCPPIERDPDSVKTDEAKQEATAMTIGISVHQDEAKALTPITIEKETGKAIKRAQTLVVPIGTTKTLTAEATPATETVANVTVATTSDLIQAVATEIVTSKAKTFTHAINDPVMPIIRKKIMGTPKINPTLRSIMQSQSQRLNKN